VLARAPNHTCIVMAQFGGNGRSSAPRPGTSEARATRCTAGADVVPLDDPPQAEASVSAAARATPGRERLIALGRVLDGIRRRIGRLILTGA
jgi:hypothetical protein